MSKPFGRYTILFKIEKTGYAILYDDHNWIFGKVIKTKLYWETYHTDLSFLFKEMFNCCFKSFGLKLSLKAIRQLKELSDNKWSDDKLNSLDLFLKNNDISNLSQIMDYVNNEG